MKSHVVSVASVVQRVSVTCLWFPRFLGSDLNGRPRRDGRLSSSRYPREKRELETYANHHSMSTRRAEMIKMINPAPDSGFDSGSSPELFNQHNDEGPMSRTAQYRKVSFFRQKTTFTRFALTDTFSRFILFITGYEAPFGTKKTCPDQSMP